MTYYVDELQRPDTDRTVYRSMDYYVGDADFFMNQVCDWLKEHNINVDLFANTIIFTRRQLK